MSFYDKKLNKVSLPLEKYDAYNRRYVEEVNDLGIQNIGYNDSSIGILAQLGTNRNYRQASVSSMSTPASSGYSISNYQLPILYDSDVIGFTVKDAITGELRQLTHRIGSTLDQWAVIGSIDTNTIPTSIKMLSITGTTDNGRDGVLNVKMNFELIYDEARREHKLSTGFYGVDLYNKQAKTYDAIYTETYTDSIEGIEYKIMPIAIFGGYDSEATNPNVSNISLAYAIQNAEIKIMILVERVDPRIWTSSFIGNFNSFGFHYGKADTQELESKIRNIENDLIIFGNRIDSIESQLSTIVNNLGLMFDKFCSR